MDALVPEKNGTNFSICESAVIRASCQCVIYSHVWLSPVRFKISKLLTKRTQPDQSCPYILYMDRTICLQIFDGWIMRYGDPPGGFGIVIISNPPGVGRIEGPCVIFLHTGSAAYSPIFAQFFVE